MAFYASDDQLTYLYVIKMYNWLLILLQHPRKGKPKTFKQSRYNHLKIFIMNQMSFKEIDNHITKHMTTVNDLASIEALDNNQICKIYQVIRPILQVVANLPFIPENWKKAISTFISILDRFCPN